MAKYGEKWLNFCGGIWQKFEHFNEMAQAATKRGRPQSQKLSRSGIVFLRDLIHTTWPGQKTRFYKGVFDEVQDPKYKHLSPPTQPQNVARAFLHAFNGTRGLPEIYLCAIEELFEINRDVLFAPSSAQPSESKSSTTTSSKQHSKPRKRKVREKPSPPEGTATVLPRANRPLNEWFSDMSLPLIKAQIVAGMLSRPALRRRLVRELLEPECISLLAQKVASADEIDYWGFFDDNGQIPEEFKRAIVAAIEADFFLMDELQRNLLQDDFFPEPLSRWIEHSGRFYSRRFNDTLAWNVSGLVKDPKFHRHSKHYYCWALSRMTTCIFYFKQVEQPDLAKALIDFCFNNRLLMFRKAIQRRGEEDLPQWFLENAKELLTNEQAQQLQRLLAKK